MKVNCVKCKESKNGDEYYKNTQKINGLSSYCKDCCRIVRRVCDLVYQRNRRKIKGYKTLEFREYSKKYPEKVKAHAILNRAIKNGKIKRGKCETCGEKNVHAHHDDYSKPLLVRFLCPIHHKLAHKITN